MLVASTSETGLSLPILDAAWPQRGLYRCVDYTFGNLREREAYVWADSDSDSIETMAVYNRHEWSDDDIECFRISRTTQEFTVVKAATDAWLKRL
jgi:hypothetical protein